LGANLVDISFSHPGYSGIAWGRECTLNVNKKVTTDGYSKKVTKKAWLWHADPNLCEDTEGWNVGTRTNEYTMDRV